MTASKAKIFKVIFHCPRHTLTPTLAEALRQGKPRPAIEFGSTV